MKRTLLSLAAATIAGVAPLHAQTVTAITGSTTSVMSVEDNVTSLMMAGMRVSATLDDNSTGFAFWGTGGTLGTSWGVDIRTAGGTQLARITMDPGTTDTYGADWTVNLFQTSNLKTLVFDGGSQYGNVLFDRSSGFTVNCPGLPSNDGTCGSNVGDDFDMSSAWSGIGAQYSNAVGLGVAAPVGDLYSTVTVDFSNASLCTASFIICLQRDNDVPDNGNSFAFQMDTDRGMYAPATTVPEPSTYALMAAGLAALGMMSRRRRQNA